MQQNMNAAVDTFLGSTCAPNRSQRRDKNAPQGFLEMHMLINNFDQKLFNLMSTNETLQKENTEYNKRIKRLENELSYLKRILQREKETNRFRDQTMMKLEKALKECEKDNERLHDQNKDLQSDLIRLQNLYQEMRKKRMEVQFKKFELSKQDCTSIEEDLSKRPLSVVSTAEFLIQNEIDPAGSLDHWFSKVLYIKFSFNRRTDREGAQQVGGRVSFFFFFFFS
ncbi:hypothetical protein TRFO_21803 [Tritrichomonas foetus]|uniref:Uncharacterized protein n=1 Tax=Tritrichomonas foetus TaxID=1144522 RepID=A0A1J4KI34_9EUKA|nr:hypothetical protein TRFO_21803 [Tritrichomonas foetus]|eukprot:OHT09318.1 hypothetical protein TRFO_21803 [Tritrichomonas foetus]